MGRCSTPIPVIVHFPRSESGKRALSEQVAQAHAEMVSRYIKNLHCPSAQKSQLLDAVIQSTHNAKTVERPR